MRCVQTTFSNLKLVFSSATRDPITAVPAKSSDHQSKVVPIFETREPKH